MPAPFPHVSKVLGDNDAGGVAVDSDIEEEINKDKEDEGVSDDSDGSDEKADEEEDEDSDDDEESDEKDGPQGDQGSGDEGEKSDDSGNTSFHETDEHKHQDPQATAVALEMISSSDPESEDDDEIPMDNKGSNLDKGITATIDVTKLLPQPAREKLAKVANSSSSLDPVGHYKKTKDKSAKEKGTTNAKDKAANKKKAVEKQMETNRRITKELPALGEPPLPHQTSWTIGKASKECAAIEVNLRGHFYLKGGPSNLEGNRQVSWLKCGGIKKAWVEAQKRQRGMETTNKKRRL